MEVGRCPRRRPSPRRRTSAPGLPQRQRHDPDLSEIAAALAETLSGRQVGLDGEIVAMDPATGAPEFGQLQQRLGTVGTPALQTQTPVSYIVFDLTHLDSQPTTDLPYIQRRTMLTGLGITHPSLLVPPHQLDVAPARLLGCLPPRLPPRSVEPHVSTSNAADRTDKSNDSTRRSDIRRG
ncbi:MAG TPA: hypothetical protein VFE65_06860 [Pseudonocardia sp.]|jgi:hypothetical protein|nr:hypothetical protein [Pseudonocardia sp.]